jgi:hypothetical protein
MTKFVSDLNPSIPTLRTLSLRLCVNYANNFISLGDLPFVLVQPILQRCSATQLAALEDHSPHLREDTQEIWARHVTERFKLGVVQRNGEDWRDLYERCILEEGERLKCATARLRQKNGMIEEAKLRKRIVVIDPKKTVVVGVKRGFGGIARGGRVNLVSPSRKKNSLIEKARRDTSIAKMNYSSAPRFLMGKASAVSRSALRKPDGGKIRQGNVDDKVRREPAPANDRNVFGRTAP